MQNINMGRGQFAVALCAVFWSTSGLFIKLLDWHPVVIAGARSLVAAIFMLAVRRAFPARGKFRRGGFNMFAAGVCYAGAMLFFVVANKLTASANVILLQYSAPVWACLLAWLLLKEKPFWEHWTALALVIGGMVLFFKEGLASGSIFGDGLAVVSGVFFGANSAFMRAQKDENPADSMLVAHILTALFAVPFFFVFPPLISPSSAGAVLFMGVVQIGCASLLFAYGIKRISTVQAMLTASIEPVLNPVWTLIVTGEKPSISALAGGAVIFFSVIFSSIIGKRRDSSN
ncbi:MAG: DMT family transporter [Treponema sp.]|jgi:drug/metabolite transporter (DMT)-like permease|nr:DMT family transporter [Treponema sp.]